MTAISINLRRLRRMKELSQQELADLSGISRNAYRAIETGKAVPRGTNLSEIARALNVSVFMLTEEIPALQSLRFRTHSALSSRQRAEREQIVADVAIWLRNLNELEGVLNESKPYRFENIDLGGNDPENAAAEARKALGLEDDRCIADICELLENAGIRLYLINSTLEKLFGLSVGPEDGGPAIAVNTEESIPIERQIFTAAHELGHLLLHSDSYDSDQTVENARQESEANIFASHFLMPDPSFGQVWSESRGLNWVQGVLHTKRIFRVSYKTVLHRLIDEGKADNSIYQEFTSSYNRLYNKRLEFKEEPDPYASLKIEPSNLESEDFIADRLSRLVRDALEGGMISRSRAAEILGISVNKMGERVKEWGMFNDG